MIGQEGNPKEMMSEEEAIAVIRKFSKKFDREMAKASKENKETRDKINNDYWTTVLSPQTYLKEKVQ